MLRKKIGTSAFFALIFALIVSLNFLTVNGQPANAQTAGTQQLKDRVQTLMDKGNFVDALPFLEQLIILEPDNAKNQFFLGTALLAKTRVVSDKTEIKALFVRAKKAFVKAKQLNYPEPKLDAMIGSIPDDGEIPNFSKNDETERIMQEAEAFFAQGKMKEALKKYQQALELDPTLYHAALFSGDVYVQTNDFDNAEIWYQKAIKIDPTIETAYRYSATPLMKQRKYDQARDRYVEAYLTDPYNNYTTGGLGQWAQVTGAKLGHPAIKIPTSYSADEKGDSNITLDADMLLNGKKDDGSFAWLVYGATRAEWQKQFVQKFPNEKTYRHSLAEELDALQSVIRLATTDKKTKNLSSSLMKLKELNDKGLLESYILLARADQGIAQDYKNYLKQNREKLRQYVTEYILTGGGK